MKKTLTFIGILLLLLVVFGLAGFFCYKYLKKQPPSTSVSELELSQEDIVGLTKPSVVRIVQHVKGKAKLPNFRIDLGNFEIVPEGGTSEEIPFDEYVSGSGFVISRDGYILTNSHVVSDSGIKNALAAIYGTPIFIKEIYRQEDKLKDMDPAEEEEKGRTLAMNMVKYITEKGEFEIENKIHVLNSSSTKESLQDLLKEAFPAEPISVNDDFLENGRDAAVIKIEQSNLPEIKLGNSDTISVSNKIAVFGFPSSAELGGKDLLEASFTNGMVNALKDSENKEFKLFQTDAKVSTGSSGGPILNSRGEVIGITTYASSLAQGSKGDNFAFGIPINAVNEFLGAYSSASEFDIKSAYSENYPTHLLRGIGLMNGNHCQLALAEFQSAKDVNQSFATARFVEPKIQSCNQLIASGKSIDSKWDEMKEKFSQSNKVLYALVGIGLTAILVLSLVIFFLMEKLKKDESQIKQLEEISFK